MIFKKSLPLVYKSAEIIIYFSLLSFKNNNNDNNKSVTGCILYFYFSIALKRSFLIKHVLKAILTNFFFL